MATKELITLTDEEVILVSNIQKKIIEIMAENLSNYDIERRFHIRTLIMALLIGNTLIDARLNIPDYYLQDFCDLVKHLYPKMKENASFMIFEKGKKVEEGDFH